MTTELTPLFNIILYQPEIPPNTGNIMRLSANLGARLHLVEPLGFRLQDRLLRRAGLDYGEWADVVVHRDWQACADQLGLHRAESAPLFALSTRGGHAYTEAHISVGSSFVFGPETRGLPGDLLASLPAERRLYIPMRPHNRSLNLSNAVAVVLYEAWRQQGFSGAVVRD